MGKYTVDALVVRSDWLKPQLSSYRYLLFYLTRRKMNTYLTLQRVARTASKLPVPVS
jgi:hypothetical protein